MAAATRLLMPAKGLPLAVAVEAPLVTALVTELFCTTACVVETVLTWMAATALDSPLAAMADPPLDGAGAGAGAGAASAACCGAGPPPAGAAGAGAAAGLGGAAACFSKFCWAGVAGAGAVGACPGLISVT